MKSKVWYSFGNIFKVKFRKHFCVDCNNALAIKKHKKIVNSKDSEAVYYDFSAGETSTIAGNVEFIHKLFYCDNCKKDVEYVTQISYEEYSKFEMACLKKALELKKIREDIAIKQVWIDIDNNILDERPRISELEQYRITILNDAGKTIMDVVCCQRAQKNIWERPFFLLKNNKFGKEVKKTKIILKTNGDCGVC